MKMNVQELRAGEILDTMVAKEVMGLIVGEAGEDVGIKHLIPGMLIPRHTFNRLAAEALKRNDTTARRIISHQIPYYSSNYAQATQVIERMVSLGYTYQLSYTGKRYLCQFGDGPQAECITAPEAICISALLALGKDVTAC